MRPEDVKKSSRDVNVARTPAAGAASLEDTEPVERRNEDGSQVSERKSADKAKGKEKFVYL
jgi:hypothetical protein